ncbi:hypothetical protein CK510_10125 [Brunnivagina elsteri CCALA 953]|uniref:Hydrogenase n=2 Tax=Brunnivagina TaxID=3344733 RepID=A0A2A2TKK1_9CYAN|nr:hypothetical protein CK510_10125 [Calothrix elsteri CCALA 953]
MWHGIFNCTLGFIIGLFIPLYANPRAGLAAHLIGITQGAFLAVIGLAYPQLKLQFWLGRVTYWLLVIGAYIGLLGQFLGAVFRLARMFIITGQGLPEGIPWMETSIEIANKTISTTLLLCCFVILYGLRGTKTDASSLENS